MKRIEFVDNNGKFRSVLDINYAEFKNKSDLVQAAYQDLRNKKITTEEFEVIYDNE